MGSWKGKGHKGADEELGRRECWSDGVENGVRNPDQDYMDWEWTLTKSPRVGAALRRDPREQSRSNRGVKPLLQLFFSVLIRVTCPAVALGRSGIRGFFLSMSLRSWREINRR